MRRGEGQAEQEVGRAGARRISLHKILESQRARDMLPSNMVSLSFNFSKAQVRPAAGTEVISVYSIFIRVSRRLETMTCD